MVTKEMSFAERLKALREARGLSQRALAKLCGLSGQAMSLLELGERVPTWPTVQLLCKALEVDCQEFKDDQIELPGINPGDMPKKAGRPRKATAEPAPPAPARAKKPTTRKKTP